MCGSHRADKRCGGSSNGPNEAASIKLVFTVMPEYVEYAEELGETVTAPVDIPELVATVAKIASG